MGETQPHGDEWREITQWQRNPLFGSSWPGSDKPRNTASHRIDDDYSCSPQDLAAARELWTESHPSVTSIDVHLVSHSSASPIPQWFDEHLNVEAAFAASLNLSTVKADPLQQHGDEWKSDPQADSYDRSTHCNEHDDMEVETGRWIYQLRHVSGNAQPSNDASRNTETFPRELVMFDIEEGPTCHVLDNTQGKISSGRSPAIKGEAL